MTKAKAISSLRTAGTFLTIGTCSETSCHVLNSAFNNQLTLEEHAIAPMAGGIKQHGYQCGLLWGAVLAAGAETYKRYGAGPQAETRAVYAAQKLVDSFTAQNGTINCLEITEIDK